MQFQGGISCPSPPSPPANPEQVVERGVETLLRGLRGAEEEPEVVIYLLALGNARLPETIPTLLELAEDGPTAVTTAATSALQRFPAPHISSEVGEDVGRLGAPLPTQSQAAAVHFPLLIAPSQQVKRVMRRIFHQTRKSYDKTCRLAAAEILLDSHPLPMDVINILLATSEMETEMATFLRLKVQNSLHDHHHLARWGLRGRVHFSLCSTSPFSPLHHLFLLLLHNPAVLAC